MYSALGRTRGLALDDHDTGAAKAAAFARAALERRLHRLGGRIENAAAEADSVGSEAASSKGRCDASRQLYEDVLAEATRAPQEFDHRKGAVYILLASLLIFADLALLGRSFAAFLGTDWRSSTTGYNFIQTLFGRPWRILIDFPDLFSLTLGILVLGVFMKVWRDVYLHTPVDDHRRAMHLWDTRAATALLALSVITIASSAAGRLFVDLGTTPVLGARWVSAIIGFSLPLISGGFYIVGYDLRFNRRRLAEAEEHVEETEAVQKHHDDRLTRLRVRLERLKEIRTKVADPAYQASRVQLRVAEYTEGYLEGVSQLLATAQDKGAYAVLMPVALRLEMRSVDA